MSAAPAILVPALENNARIVLVLADQSYRGAMRCVCSRHTIVFGTHREMGQGFVVEPWRWVVERTFAWLGTQLVPRRELPEHHEGFHLCSRKARKLTQNQRTRQAVTVV